MITQDNVIAILKEVRPECEFADTDDFFDEGLLDSFDLSVLVASLEERFGVVFASTDIAPENFRNVGAILSLLTARRTNGGR
jgi:acyl carrier protein